jgi:DNA-directed RNA polymerase III subunit RPC4
VGSWRLNRWFSANVNIDRKANNRTPSTFGSGSGSRATRIKNEGDGDYAGSSSRSSGGGGGGGGGSSSGGGGGSGTYVKRENGESGSEDEDEENAEFPRKNIDYIEISSDENDAPPADRPQRATLPVRLGRKEHDRRTIVKDTEADLESSSQAAEKSEATDENPAIGDLKQPSGKGKGKTKDGIPAITKKSFKGVWQDSEDEQEEQNAVQVGIIDAPQQTAGNQDPSLESERKMKGAVKGFAKPVLQTKEDEQEWARFQKNLSHIRAELGPDRAAVDLSGDVNMEDAAVAPAKKPTVRDNNVYLFQIPPLMPEVSLSSIKDGPPDVEDQSAPVPPAKPEVKIKVEEGFSEASMPVASAFASGCVGRMRVRESGRTTLDWGGTSFELKTGNRVSFLQELCRINVVPEKDRVVSEEAGDATSFGRVKGKFVVVPDWNLMLG